MLDAFANSRWICDDKTFVEIFFVFRDDFPHETRLDTKRERRNKRTHPTAMHEMIKIFLLCRNP
jgi:hypothetical protein